jgi:hypothetical protein
MARTFPGLGTKSASNGASNGAAVLDEAPTIDLRRHREQLNQKVAELQWDLGGLVYEMAVRDRIRVDVIVQRAAELQDAEAELAEAERILAIDQTGIAGVCGHCNSPHSAGASFCWQCGQPVLHEVDTSSIFAGA